MTSPLNRDDLIELLESLGSERDETALAAARQVHDRIAAAGLTWEDLLRPDDGGGGDLDDRDDRDDRDDLDDSDDSEDDRDDLDDSDDSEDDRDDLDDGDDTEDDHPEDAAPETPGDRAKRDAESLTLIDKLLARPGISDDFRQELLDYKIDIAEGDFTAADHRYLRALHARLSKPA